MTPFINYWDDILWIWGCSSESPRLFLDLGQFPSAFLRRLLSAGPHVKALRHYSHFERVIMRHGLDFFPLHVDIYFSQYNCWRVFLCFWRCFKKLGGCSCTGFYGAISLYYWSMFCFCIVSCWPCLYGSVMLLEPTYNDTSSLVLWVWDWVLGLWHFSYGV